MNKRIWEDPSIQQKNALKSRSFVKRYDKFEDAKNDADMLTSKYVESLAGEWDFQYHEIAGQVNLDEQVKVESLEDKIPVPSSWQKHGYGKMAYNNVAVPFPLRQPLVPADNPLGHYRLVKENIVVGDNEQKILRFHGVDSFFVLYVNSKEVGCSKGPRYTTEFDITKYIENDKAVIDVFVYRWSDGSHIEDQDQWWFSGIYRNVELVTENKNTIKDIFVKTTRVDNSSYDLSIKLDKDEELEITYRLFNEKNEILLEETTSNANIIKRVTDIKEWNAESPNLYRLVVSASETDHLGLNVGFRQIIIDGRVFRINSKPVMMKGVNYHSYSKSGGKTVSLDEIKHDLLLMKQHNMNAIRTSHYPQPVEFYDLCDKYGFYVIDEADLEAHAHTCLQDTGLSISDDPNYEEAFILRGTRMVERDKNFPSIIMWSLGNETTPGKWHHSMKYEMKKIDDTRPFHFETDYDVKIQDVYSRMYTGVESYDEFWKDTDLSNMASGKDLEGKLRPEWQVPFMLCEFVHAMGNGPGHIYEYFETFYSNECFMGAFAWEWFDHGAPAHDPNAPVYKDYYKYGGDFGEIMHDGNFCIDGMIQPDKNPSPGLIEYGSVITPAKFEYKDGKIEITNRYDFNMLKNIKVSYEIIDAENNVVSTDTLDVNDIEPRQSKLFDIKSFATTKNSLHFINVKAELLNDEGLLKSGHILSVKSAELPDTEKFESSINKDSGTIVVEESAPLTSMVAGDTKLVINNGTGHIECVEYNGKKVFLSSGQGNFWRAPIDNDRNFTKDWYTFYFLTITSDLFVSHVINKEDNYVEYQVRLESTTANQAWYYDTLVSYRLYASGEIEYKRVAKTAGLIDFKRNEGDKQNQPMFFPRIGTTWTVNKEFDKVEYFGRGPGETYVDSNIANPYGKYETSVDGMFFNYITPQENGNREKTVWTKLTDGDINVKISAYDANSKFGFGYSWYGDRDLQLAMHQNELKKNDFLTLHIDEKQNGLGSNSCGPVALKRHWAKFEDFELHLHIKFD